MVHYDDVDAPGWDTEDSQQVRLDDSGVLLIRYTRPTVLTLETMRRQWHQYLRVGRLRAAPIPRRYAERHRGNT